MTDDIDWDRLGDHLAGRTSLAERAELARWIAGAPDRQRLVSSLERLWARSEAMRDPAPELDAPAALRTLSARIDQWEATAARAVPIPRPRAIRWGGVTAGSGARGGRASWYLAAAAVVLLAVGGFAVLQRLGWHAPWNTAPLAVREVVTARGQRAELHLADGSRVILGVDSKLRWPSTFGARTRDVTLEGEALFTVTHDAARPFVVRSGGAVITDLGTEFGVRAYPGDPSVRVVVRSGSVALAPMRDSLTHRAVLGAADMGSLSADGALRVEHGVDVEGSLAFADGRIALNDTPMDEIARELDRWYGVRLVVDDTSLAHATVRASFATDADLSTVMRTLARALGARAEQHGDTVRLTTHP